MRARSPKARTASWSARRWSSAARQPRRDGKATAKTVTAVTGLVRRDLAARRARRAAQPPNRLAATSLPGLTRQSIMPRASIASLMHARVEPGHDSGAAATDELDHQCRPAEDPLVLRREVPENLWIKCPETGQMVFHKDLEANQFVIPGFDLSHAHRRDGAAASRCSTAATFDDIALPRGRARSAEIPRRAPLRRPPQGRPHQDRHAGRHEGRLSASSTACR